MRELEFINYDALLTQAENREKLRKRRHIRMLMASFVVACGFVATVLVVAEWWVKN